jgi:uncharacterized protein (AIM24 family)
LYHPYKIISAYIFTSLPVSDGFDIDYDVQSELLYIAAKEGLVVMDTNGTESVQIVRNGEPQHVSVDPIGRYVVPPSHCNSSISCF